MTIPAWNSGTHPGAGSWARMLNPLLRSALFLSIKQPTRATGASGDNKADERDDLFLENNINNRREARPKWQTKQFVDSSRYGGKYPLS